MTTWLTPHFSLEEMTITSQRAMENVPNEVIQANLLATCRGLESVRMILGNLPILISSGYRSPQVNKAVGGVWDSAHLSGWAADFICPAYGDPLAICGKLQNSSLPFDQVIEEGTWTHISFDPRARNQILTKAPGSGYSLGLPK